MTSDEQLNLYAHSCISGADSSRMLNEWVCCITIHSAKRARVEALRTCFARELLLSTIVLPSHLEPPATVDLKTLAAATSRASLSLSSVSSASAGSAAADPLVAPVAPRTSSGLSLIVQPT